MSECQPLISVIIPVYNAERFLRGAVDSVIGQTYQNWELLLIDDGSYERDGDMCDEYAKGDKRIRVLHTEKSGACHKRNVGLTQAVGDWVFFLDNDDWIEPYALERLVAYSENVDVVMGNYPEKPVVWHNVKEPRVFSIDDIDCEELSELFFLRMFHPVWNKLYRRERIVGGFREDVSYIDDVTFNLAQFPNWRRVAVIPDMTYHYVHHQDSLSYIVRFDRMEQVRTSINLFNELFPWGSDVMNTLSRWYVIELRLYFMYYIYNESIPEDRLKLLLTIWLSDDWFDHRKISTVLLNDKLRGFWDAVLRKDMDSIIDLIRAALKESSE